MTLKLNPERLAERFLRMNPKGWSDAQARRYAIDAYLGAHSGFLSVADLDGFADAFLEELRTLSPITR